MCTTNGQDHAGRLSHQACVYAGTAELERGICRFVEEGLAGASRRSWWLRASACKPLRPGWGQRLRR